MLPRLRTLGLAAATLALAYGCGARTSLPGPSTSTATRSTSGAGGYAGHGGQPGQGGSGGEAGHGGEPGTGGRGGAGGQPGCNPGDERPCGSDVGECKLGREVCQNGVFGPCTGSVGPTPETCNGLDDDCNGQIDEGFHLGEACDGPDSDLCLDDVVTCNGCSKGPDTLETCNGVDDNCNGIIDSDCDTGDCEPSLLVTGSTPSNPNCIDFPVEKGSTGVITYPCAGGPVTAQLGSLQFSGSVANGVVSLDAQADHKGPDGCTWHMTHHIGGKLPDGVLDYSYAEEVVAGSNCWQPCTETGTVKVSW
jgi:hypothetical protein